MNLYTAAAILVVDESEAICELIELLLVRVGYEVRTATNAADAARIADEMPALDVLLCGEDLPDMSGAELAVWVSASHPSASVVLVAPSYALNDGTRGVGILEKPFSIAELRSVVRSALTSRREPSQPGLSAVAHEDPLEVCLP